MLVGILYSLPVCCPPDPRSLATADSFLTSLAAELAIVSTTAGAIAALSFVFSSVDGKGARSGRNLKVLEFPDNRNWSARRRNSELCGVASKNG